MNISTFILVDHSLSWLVPLKPHCACTYVLKKVGQMGREIWEFISLPSAQLMDEFTMQLTSGLSWRNPSWKTPPVPGNHLTNIYASQGVQERQYMCREKIITEAIRAQACHQQWVNVKGSNPESLTGALLDTAIHQHCYTSEQDGLMWMLLFHLSPWFLNLEPLWSISSLASLYTNFLAH